ncbi:hypothetical protein [Streptomyces sp. ISL-44]|uniref:hypothetical protein n=1 Tax=Streptomyces sp. ISL-44 TaxID=2819184 RepID=UPI0027E25347|nr:hypothetical protein [Streptomyces sp. ISL-44]
MTTTPSSDPRIEAVAARLREAAQERAATYGPPPAWEPIWKPPQKPKSIKARKAELAKQRKRLKAAGIRRFYGGHSRRPRPRQNRIGSAAALMPISKFPRCRSLLPIQLLCQRTPLVLRRQTGGSGDGGAPAWQTRWHVRTA